MKSKKLLLTIFLLLFPINIFAQDVYSPEPADQIQEKRYYERKDHGWFIGSDQGVLFFVGDGSEFIDPQYYGSIYGGYSYRGILQPMIKLGQAIGSTGDFLDATTFFFIFEAGIRVVPLQTKVRPYFIGTAGGYVLDFFDFDFPVQEDTNFTYSVGGGIEVEFGPSHLTLGSEYRGFINDGIDLQGVAVTIGYLFEF